MHNENFDTTNYILDEEFIKNRKKLLPSLSGSKHSLGPEFSFQITNDKELCEKIISSNLLHSIELYESMKKYLTDRLKRYIKKHSYYDASRFLSKLQSSSAKYLNEEKEKFNYDTNAKRI